MLLVAPQGNAAGGFSGAELSKLTPVLDRYGVVGLSEMDAKGLPKAITLAVRIRAPRDVVFDIFKDPKNFYYLSTLFKENRALERHENSLAYEWASRHKFFSFTGVNHIAYYPPRRVDVKIAKSTIGNGTFKLVFHEEAPDRTLLVLSGLLDVETSEWLLRFLIGNNPAMKQAMNVAIGVVIVKGTKALAERLARGKKRAKHKAYGRNQKQLRALSKKELRAIKPLLDRGTVILTGSLKGGRLRQVVAVEEVRAPRLKLLGAIAAPELYPKMIGAISEVSVSSRDATSCDFSWNLGFSVFGLESRNRLDVSPRGVDIKALDGDLEGAKWLWQFAPNGKESTIVAYHGYADVKQAGYILEKTVKREPYLEHGFMAGSNMVMLRAIKRAVSRPSK